MMGWTGIIAASALAWIASAAHAEDVTFNATPYPIVTAEVNGKPARFQIDTTLPDVAVLNPAAAQRFGVRAIPAVGVQIGLDDAMIKGRIARPRIVFANGAATRSFVGLFGAPYSAAENIDGAIGPGVLPYDRIRFVLRDGAAGEHVHTIALQGADKWDAPNTFAGVDAVLRLNLARRETVMSRPMTRVLSNASLLTPSGALAPTLFPLGLTTAAQPAQTSQTIAGFALGPTLVRTDAPLVAPDGVDMVTVVAHARKKPDYNVTLGRAALAGCSDIVWDRAARRLTLHCDN